MRRTPEQLKVLRGTARPDRPPRRRPQPALGTLPASDTWPEAVQRRYTALVAALGDLATEADAGVLELTARALAEVEELDALLGVEGLIYTSGTRNMRRPNPAVALRADAQRRALAGLRALGLTPVDRGRVEVIEPPSRVDLKAYSR